MSEDMGLQLTDPVMYAGVGLLIAYILLRIASVDGEIVTERVIRVAQIGMWVCGVFRSVGIAARLVDGHVIYHAELLIMTSYFIISRWFQIIRRFQDSPYMLNMALLLFLVQTIVLPWYELGYNISWALHAVKDLEEFLPTWIVMLSTSSFIGAKIGRLLFP